MKTQENSGKALGAMQVLAALLLGLCFVGCSSTGYKKSDAAARSLDIAAAEVQTESRDLELTMTTLNELVNKPASDLRPQFNLFSSSLDRLVASGRRNDNAARRTLQKSSAYFETWDKELGTMNYEVIRTRSQARKTEVSNHFDQVHRQYHEAQTALYPLLDYLQDIRTALSADLTPGGLEAVKPIVNNANENADKVRTALAKLSNDLAVASTRMSSFTMQRAQAAPPPAARPVK
jgi:uncharacterized membrane-anchored protein YhcB (DUF1043 family)